jgi:hypothetical protein
MTIDAMRILSHWLMIAAISLPILGGLAGAARYLVQRRVERMADEQRRAEAGDLREALAGAQAKVHELESNAAPRLLTSAQRAALIERLSKNPGRIVFKILIGDTEAQQYAEQLETAFVASGWTVTTERALFMPAFAGLRVSVVSSQIGADDPAAVVMSALQNASVELAHPPASIENVPEGEAWLKISSKR